MIHTKEIKGLIESGLLLKNRPIAFLGPIGIGKTASIKEGIQELAKVYNTPVVFIVWNFCGGKAEYAFVQRFVLKGKGGIVFDIEVLPKDVLTYVFHPDGSVEEMNLYDILPKYEEFLRDKYVVFLLEYFTNIHPREQGKFIEFFDEGRLGIYDFKKHSKGFLIIIEGHYKTESYYIYDLAFSIKERVDVFPVYTTQDHVAKIAKKLNWHPVLQAFLQYEEINVHNHNQDDYISPRELAILNNRLYLLDAVFKRNESYFEEYILAIIAGDIKATDNIEAEITLKGVANKSKVPVAKLIKAYYDLYRNTPDFLEVIRNYRDWRDVIKKEIMDIVGRFKVDCDIHKSNIQQDEQNFLIKREYRVKVVNLVIAIDISCSMSYNEIKSVLNELRTIERAITSNKIHVLFTSDRIVDEYKAYTITQVVDYITNKETKNYEIHTDGVVDFGPVFKKVKEHFRDEPVLVLFFTDMQGIYPNKNNIPPNIKTLWVTTAEGQKPPFGKVIEVVEKDEQLRRIIKHAFKGEGESNYPQL